MPNQKRQRREVENIHVIDGEVDPIFFFDQYIVQRKPVKFTTLIKDENWRGDRWSNKFLREKSGDTTLRVETRDGSNESFGRGNEKKMTFNSFIDSLEQENETSFYLTTQELSYTHEGQPSLTSPPVDGLIGDFPWVPKICGNLIPQNINLWFGSSKLPTSSGLHHDFHDNLYLLLRGEKRITLFSPDEAHNMYTVGEIVKIHPNGRINYKGQLTNADGSDEASLIALKASADLDKAAQLLSSAEEEDDVELAEKRIEDALEALLDAEIAGNDDSEEEGSEDEECDENAGYESLNLLREIGGKSEHSGDEEDDDEDNDDDFMGQDDYVDSDEETPHSSSSKVVSMSSSGNSAETSSNSILPSVEQEISVTDASSHSLAGVSTSIKSPPNFSAVDTALPLEQLALRFPKYYEALTNSRCNAKEGPDGEEKGGCVGRTEGRVGDAAASRCTELVSEESTHSSSGGGARCVEVTLKAGQMLYIPTGWFHEVRSTGGGGDGHLALNYWFHPPDGSSFEKPYTSDFWPIDWEKRNMK